MEHVSGTAVVIVCLVGACFVAWLIRRFNSRRAAGGSAGSSMQRRSGTTYGSYADEENVVSPLEYPAAATVGSDYYVPSSDELTSAIEVNVFDRQKRDALNLARQLISEYRRRVENGEAKSVYCVIANPLVADYNVMNLCEKILKERGWSARDHGNSTAFVGPFFCKEPSPFARADLQQIADSDTFASLIESNILAPRKALALSIAKQLVEGYRLKLEADKPTSLGITVSLEQEIDYNVFTEVEKVLAPRGWTVSHIKGRKYNVWPADKLDIPARRGRSLII